MPTMTTTPIPDDDPFKHLTGMPPALMCEVEQRLTVRIHAAILESGTVVSENRFFGWKWRSLGAMDSDKHAHDILYRMLRQRMRDGKQFDSILEASRIAFAHLMIQDMANKGGV